MENENYLHDLAGKTLAFLEEKAVDDAVVTATKSTRYQIRFTKNEGFISKTWNSTNLSVFLSKHRKIASTDLNDVSDFKHVHKSLKDLLVFTGALKENNDYRGIADGPFEYQTVPQTYDSSMKDFSDHAVDSIQSGINAANDAGANYSAGMLQWQINEELLRTNHGVEIKEQGSNFEFIIRSFLSPTETGQGLSIGCMLDSFDPIQAGSNAGELAAQARGAKPAKGGIFNALFAPTVAADLIGQPVRVANPFWIEAGQSWLQDKIGEQLTKSRLTAADDGTYPNGLWSSKADAEGVPSRKTTIIENGVLKGLIYNTSTARKAGVQSTGNAGLIAPENRNICIKPGDYSFDELLAECKAPTIYVTNNWYTTQTSAIEGIFSSITRDAMFLVENGEIQRPIRELRISDKFPNLLQNIVAIQNKIRQIKWWVEVTVPTFAPAVLVENVRFTTGTQ